MWEIKPEKKELLKRLRNRYYAETLDKSDVYICQILNGYKCNTVLAKAILSIFYNISVADEQMNKLLEEHFSRID
jgi:hypothetical protein